MFEDIYNDCSSFKKILHVACFLFIPALLVKIFKIKFIIFFKKPRNIKSNQKKQIACTLFYVRRFFTMLSYTFHHLK